MPSKNLLNENHNQSTTVITQRCLKFIFGLQGNRDGNETYVLSSPKIKNV